MSAQAKTLERRDSDPDSNPPSAPPARRRLGRDGRIQLAQGLALAALVAGAFVLRFVHAASVPADPYYDSAIRSMGTSLHNFLFGSLEPGGTVSLDKPPLDLWPAVISTKIFGLSSLAMRLPEILGGTMAVAFIFLAVRELFGFGAGLAAGAALAVMPIEVITARSDTTDSLMMALCSLALVLLVTGLKRQRRWLLFAAAAAMGLAFNVKLTESWPALLPLAVIGWLGLRGSQHRLRTLAIGGATYLAVALGWLTITLFVPAHSQPFAVGSTNGSPWNAAFVFNGIDRLKQTQALEGTPGIYDSHRHYPQATQAQRNAIPITPPSATRLLVRFGPLSGGRLGLEVLVAALLGLAGLGAAVYASVHRRRSRAAAETGHSNPTDGNSVAEIDRRELLKRAMIVGVALWLIEGTVLFSGLSRLHPRYTEAFLPAVAAAFGIGAAYAVRRSGAAAAAILVVLFAVLLPYMANLLYGTTGTWWISLALAVVAVAALALARRFGDPLRHLALAALVGCTLAIPLACSLEAVAENASDGNVLGSLPASELTHLSSYLKAHRSGARFLSAYDSATQMGALVLATGQPVLPLTSNEGLVLIDPKRLAADAHARLVRFLVLSGRCPRPADRENADCSATVEWVRAHGRDVSAQAQVPQGTLWLLPGWL